MIESPPINPQRVETFARFFKNYMSVSAIVAAALPIPVTSFHLIPTYSAHTSLLSVYTTLFCFLLLGLIFYSRHPLARWMFPDSFDTHRRGNLGRIVVSLLPAVLIAASLTSLFSYHYLLGQSIRYYAHWSEIDPGVTSYMAWILTTSELWQIPWGSGIVALYLGIFVFAESAFIIMAIKEYLQDLIKLSEVELIRGKGRRGHS
jgi:hypothetical protein